MSETTTATTPAAPAVARTPASIAARTVLFALGLLAAMRIGDALAGVLVPSVGRALVEQAVGGGSAMGAADAVVSASATGPASAASTAGAAGSAGMAARSGIGAHALVALLHALVLAPVALRARVAGSRLALAVGGTYALIVWVLNEIEAAVYIGTLMPDGFARATGITQGVVAIAAGTLAAAFLGPRPPGPAPLHPTLLDRGLPLRRWATRVGATSIVYLVLYFVAGVFIALRDPKLQVFYEPIGLPGPEVVVALQLGRGAIWAAVVALLLWTLDTGRRAAAVIVAFACSILMASALIPANPFLPPEVQSTHFVEIASSNFLFGLAAAWILTRRA